MIIIFGLRRLRKGMGPILLRCSNCGASPLVLFRISTWFALFFIPVIPVSFKHYTACPNCKRFAQISKADVERAREYEATLRPSRAEESASIKSESATLEQAVNEWALAGPAPSGPSGSGPAIEPAPLSVSDSPPPAPPAGWYADPAGGSAQRYWDGQRWTEHTTSIPPSA